MLQSTHSHLVTYKGKKGDGINVVVSVVRVAMPLSNVVALFSHLICLSKDIVLVFVPFADGSNVYSIFQCLDKNNLQKTPNTQHCRVLSV